MSTICRPAHGLRDRTERYVGGARPIKTSNRIRTHGYLYCISCGGPAMSKSDFAIAAGVSVRDVTAWLERKPVRDDVARRIRSKLSEVDE
jgi:hypothetical protein